MTIVFQTTYLMPPINILVNMFSFCLHSLDSGVAGCSGNTTVVIPVTRHHDESLHSPASTPAVEGEGEE